VDVILGPGVALAVKEGDHVKGGSSVLGHFTGASTERPDLLQETRRER
jgi:hypothetical protein